MVQGGDPNSKDAPAGKRLGEGGPGYTVEAEITEPVHIHRRGALAAAPSGRPGESGTPVVRLTVLYSNWKEICSGRTLKNGAAA